MWKFLVKSKWKSLTESTQKVDYFFISIDDFRTYLVINRHFGTNCLLFGLRKNHKNFGSIFLLMQIWSDITVVTTNREKSRIFKPFSFRKLRCFDWSGGIVDITMTSTNHEKARIFKLCSFWMLCCFYFWLLLISLWRTQTTKIREFSNVSDFESIAALECFWLFLTSL